MKKLLLSLMVLVTSMTFSKFTYCQKQNTEPIIISIVPDSLTTLYDYSPTMFITVKLASQFDSAEKAIQKLQLNIVELCKSNKMDAFILKEIVFVNPFTEKGVLIGYGTMIRLKTKESE